MRILLGLALVLSLAACGGAKKKSAQSPAPAPANETKEDAAGDDDVKNAATPDDPDDAKPLDKSADPQEGGE